jgi:hypothetical protein
MAHQTLLLLLLLLLLQGGAEAAANACLHRQRRQCDEALHCGQVGRLHIACVN